ncbi:MAG: AI-2E family transporter [Acidobacteria bacterium]|nr:AI-2E family transporter [Acidobacteriota bacterium]
MSPDDNFTSRMVRTVFTVAGVLILCAALWAARDALLLIYVSALLAMGCSPLVHFLERPGRRGLPRWAAILAVYIAIVGVIVLFGLLVIPPLVAQAAALWNELPEEFNRVQAFFISRGLMTRPITLAEAVQNAPSGSGSNAVGTMLVAVSSLIGGVFGLITILILSFYFLIEAHAMAEYIARFVPAERRAAAGTAAREAVVKVSAWLRAQFILAAVMGTFAAIGLGLMGVPYFYVIALVASFGEMIPIVGPVIGGVTAVAVAATVSTKLALIAGGYFVALHQLEANILVPKIMERRVGVSPVVVMMALLVGGALSGLPGAILAIPTAAILSVVIEEIAASDNGRTTP